MGPIIHTTDHDFDRDVLQSELPVLVDFWAEWCPPCKMIAPLLDEAVGTYAGELKIAKLNVDENQRTAANFNIRSIPSLLLFKNGRLATQKVGALSKSALAAWLDSELRQTQRA